jgi:CRP/FNR family transcriptional regulator, anaerobic regulatory protein
MTRTERDRLMKCYPVLASLPADLYRQVEREIRLAQAPAGRQLFDEGSPCTHFPLLVDGVIRATKASPEGHEILLYRLNPGESCVITVVALLGGTSYPARASAETDLEFYGLPRSLFLELILQSPPFRAFVFQFLSQRMAHLMTLIDDVAFRRVDQRLASRLLLHREPLTLTHQMLADELGTTREVVSRTLESFQDSGMLRLGRKRIEILDRPALGRIHRAEPA